MAPSTSRRMILPPGPEPAMAESSRPPSLAMRRASGDERTGPDCEGDGAGEREGGRAPAWRAGAGAAAGAGFSVGCSVVGCGLPAGAAPGEVADDVGAFPPADAMR